MTSPLGIQSLYDLFIHYSQVPDEDLREPLPANQNAFDHDYVPSDGEVEEHFEVKEEEANQNGAELG